PLLRQLGLRPIALGLVQFADLPGSGFGLVETASEESWCFQIVLEEIGERFEAAWIPLHGLLKILARLGSVAGRCKWAGSLRPASIRPPQPQGVFRVFRIGLQGIFQGLSGFLVLALHILVAADQL